MPLTFLIVASLLLLRVMLARRPVWVSCRTLILLFGAALAVDVASSAAMDENVVPALVLLGVLAISYPVGSRVALLFRATTHEIENALGQSARMVRLTIEGGPGCYRISSTAPLLTVEVATLGRTLHPLIFGGNLASSKTELLRKVLAKQFGRLIPIFIRWWS